ncbi:Riboflavin synthase [Posidoniimonas polymericola]|uniref:Riboflavin synthase n=1 Tax=Posidoniimonas polymericola TaxID=2528002 RepID=A0A5C5XZ77_9BACT|nr:riboflavin synthase [Posidoniimonas polymericola]TWT66792.1 Riboflavin synthase [Posidoniimonas polymericola]
MFTGLVRGLAEVIAVTPDGPGVTITIDRQGLEGDSDIGASIALNGCCLTVVANYDDRIDFQAGEETLSRTNLGQLEPGCRVNVEPSLRAGDPIGGHYVTGHIDGLGTVDQRDDDAEWSKFYFRVPASLTRQMATKGSVAVDGVSLTLVDVEDERFSVALIPHTLQATTLGGRQVGDRVNLETDVLAKYVERQLVQKS